MDVLAAAAGAIGNLPVPGGPITLAPSARGGRPGATISGIRQPPERTVSTALEFERKVFQPVTKPAGRLAGQAVVEGLAQRFNVPRGAPGRERAVEIGGDVGSAVAGEALLPTNLIPIPVIDPLVARAVTRAAQLVKVAIGPGARVTRTEAGRLVEAIGRVVAGEPDEAVRGALAQFRGDLARTLQSERGAVPLGPGRGTGQGQGFEPEAPRALGEGVPDPRPSEAAERGTLATVADDAERAAQAGARGLEPPGGPPTIPERGRPELPSPRVLKTVDEIAGDIRRSTQNFVGATTRTASRFPPLRAMIDFVNPSSLVERPAKGLVDELGEQGAIDLQGRLIAHGRKMDQGSAISSAIEDGVRLRGREVGLRVEDGLVTTVDGSPPVGDLFENPSRYSLTPEQRKFVDDVQSVLDDMNAAEKAAGVKKGEIFSGEGRYFPRQVREIRGVENIRGDVRRIVGARQGFSKERFYATMQDGLDAGVRYEDDIGAIVGTRIRAGIKAAADEELAVLVRPLGRTLKAPRRTAGIAELGTATPALGGRVFKPETARLIMDALNPAPPGTTLRSLDAVNNLLRPINATGELSFWGIQMMTSLFRNPAAFAKGAAMSLDGLLLDGRFYGRFIQRNAPWIERFIANDGVWNGSEFTFEQAVRNKTIRGLFEKFGIKGALGRFDQAFNQALNITALENFKGMVGLTDNLGPSRVNQAMRTVLGDIAGETSDEVAASIASKMTGRLPVRGLGVKATQRAVESSLAFAPRYYRAIFGLLGDAIQGGMRGAEARRIFGSLFAGAVTLHVGIAYSLGQEPRLDPRRSDFLTVTIRGQKIGIGGPIYGIGRMLAESVENPGKLKSFSMDNPLARWARGRTAPVLSLVTDLVTQTDFLGRPITSPGDIMRELAKAPLPFIAQQAIEEGPEAIPPQAFGLRAFPESAFDVRNEARRDAMRDLGFAGNYDDLNEIQQAEVNGHPKVQEAQQGVQGLPARDRRGEGFDFLDTLRERTDTEQLEDDAAFEAGTMDGSRWRQRRSDRERALFGNREVTQEIFGITFEDEEAGNRVDAAIAAYFAVELEDFTDEGGESDWRGFRQAQTEALSSLSAGERESFQELILGKNDTPVEQRFRVARQRRDELGEISPIRDIGIETWEMLQDFWREVNDERAAARLRGREIGFEEAIRALAAFQKRDERDPGFTEAAVLFRPGTKARDAMRNRDYDLFLLRNFDALWPFYQDDLYGSRRMQDLIFQARQAGLIGQEAESPRPAPTPVLETASVR